MGDDSASFRAVVVEGGLGITRGETVELHLLSFLRCRTVLLACVI